MTAALPAPRIRGSSPRHARNAPSPAIATAKRHHTIVYASMDSSTTLSAIGSNPHSAAVVSESVKPSRQWRGAACHARS